MSNSKILKIVATVFTTFIIIFSSCKSLTESTSYKKRIDELINELAKFESEQAIKNYIESLKAMRASVIIHSSWSVEDPIDEGKNTANLIQYDIYIYNELKGYGKEVVKSLLSALQTYKNEIAQYNIIESLGWVGDKEALPYLTKWLEDKLEGKSYYYKELFVSDSDKWITCAVIDAIGRFKDKSTENLLLRTVSCDDMDISFKAAESLANMGNKEWISIFSEIAKGNDKEKADKAVYLLNLYVSWGEVLYSELFNGRDWWLQQWQEHGSELTWSEQDGKFIVPSQRR